GSSWRPIQVRCSSRASSLPRSSICSPHVSAGSAPAAALSSSVALLGCSAETLGSPGCSRRPLQDCYSVMIETERLRLRPLTMDDLDEVVALHARPEVSRFMRPLPREQAVE